MKTLISSFFIALLTFFTYTHTYAVPLYYTFEGRVSAIAEDDAGIIADAGITDGISGSELNYVIKVDFDAARTTTYTDGSVYTFDSTATTSLFDFNNFYADFTSGGLIGPKNGGAYTTIGNSVTDVAEYNWGMDRTRVDDASDYFGELHVGSINHYIQIQGRADWLGGAKFTDEWIVGDRVQGIEIAYSSDGTRSGFYSSLYLTSISETLPVVNVPEPPALLLFFLGLMVLFGLGKTKNSR